MRVRGVTAFPAEKRADLIAGRIRAIAADRSISTSMLRIEETEDLSRILAGKQLVMVITDADARIEQLDRRNLANAYVSRISEVIRDYRRDRSTELLARSGLYALAATGALVLFSVAWCARNETARQRSSNDGSRPGSQESRRNRCGLLSAAQLWQTLRGLRSLLWTADRAGRIPGLSGFPPAVCFHGRDGFGLRLFDLLFDPLRTIGTRLSGRDSGSGVSGRPRGRGPLCAESDCICCSPALPREPCRSPHSSASGHGRPID